MKGGIKLTESHENKCVTEVYGLIHVKIPQEISNNVYIKTIMKTAGDQVPILREIELPHRHEEILV